MPQCKVLKTETNWKLIFWECVKSYNDSISAVCLLVDKRNGYDFVKFSSTNNH